MPNECSKLVGCLYVLVSERKVLFLGQKPLVDYNTLPSCEYIHHILCITYILATSGAVYTYDILN